MHTELSISKIGLHVCHAEGTGPSWLCSEMFAGNTTCELASSPCTEHRFFMGTKGRHRAALGFLLYTRYLYCAKDSLRLKQHRRFGTKWLLYFTDEELRLQQGE